MARLARMGKEKKKKVFNSSLGVCTPIRATFPPPGTNGSKLEVRKA
jgi:hypothetical protein